MGVSLPTSRCARVGKVGVLRATLSLRCYASHRADARPSHASRRISCKYLKPSILCLTL
ncbi:MAG: hypothetical protein NZ455_11710 [Bacteroidia bacterium]|nr:hypothetical protein [Bacteroidia bacterium]MDW8346744.1 hypothetical protein [Bacteroidia bacterium]